MVSVSLVVLKIAPSFTRLFLNSIAFVKLPLWARLTPLPYKSAKKGWIFLKDVSPVVEYLLCPIENLSVLGGDGQNILTWEEPANPFLVTFTVAITTDSWPTEISWDLVNNGDGAVVSSISAGDLTNAGELYTWDQDIEHGNYTFTIYDTFGDGNSGGFILYI